MGKLTPKRPARLKAEVIEGDCREVMAKMPDASVDSIVTDPPYHLTSIVDRFGKPNAAPAQYGRDGAYARQSKGFMGKTWDGGAIAQSVELWREAWRVLKPGGHLLAFGGTRTAHRMVCAIEDAGFEIRDSVIWMYGSGFPKSHDVSKEIDKRAGAKRKVVGINQGALRNKRRDTVWTGDVWGDNDATITAPATDAAKQWEGWGSALKPSHEPLCLARKPLSGTIAANVLKHGTGALNINGCRVDSGGVSPSIARRKGSTNHLSDRPARETEAEGKIRSRQSPEAFRAERVGETLGRWPANLIHDGSAEVEAEFAKSGTRNTGTRNGLRGTRASFAGNGQNGTFSEHSHDTGYLREGDSGSASRFFYSPKASKEDREEVHAAVPEKYRNLHPTVKPVALMRYLCRLITPPGGLVLDPFCGSGSTGKAALIEGFQFIGIESDPAYVEIARARVQPPLFASYAPTPAPRREYRK